MAILGTSRGTDRKSGWGEYITKVSIREALGMYGPGGGGLELSGLIFLEVLPIAAWYHSWH
jgi:hypothetical protein